MSDSLQGNSSLHVVLAADNNYAVPLLVSVYSLYKTANEGTSYAVHALVPPDFKSTFKDALFAMASDFCMPTPHFVDMGTAYADVIMQLEFITPQTYYRLMIPDLFDFDVCLYLDVDILVRKDLDELFSQLGKEDLIAGVKAAGYYWPVEEQQKKAQTLMISAFDQYVNAGILLMNVKRMRELNMSRTFHKLMEKDFRSQDQDILNSACYGAIRLLPPKYNSMTMYDNDDASGYDSELHQCLPICYAREEWAQACEDPAIIHYANKRKPWSSLAISHALLWWDALSEVNEYYECKDVLVQQLAEGEAKHRRLDAATLAGYKAELVEVRQDRARAWDEARESRERIEEASKRAREANERAQEANEALAYSKETIQAFSKNTAARCDLRLTSKTNPQLVVQNITDPLAYTMVPTWFGKNETGYLVSSNRGTLSFTVTCKTAGTLRIMLRGSDVRDSKGNRTDYWIKVCSFTINNEPILEKDGLAVCYSNSYVHNIPVTANEEIRISYTWDVHSFEKELQHANDERQRLIEEIRRLEATILELEAQIRSQEAHAESLGTKLRQCKEEIDRIKSSGTYKLARALGTPIRKLRALLKR